VAEAYKGSLYRKLAKVMSQVDRVPKTGHNAFHKYDYVTESDLVEKIRGFLAVENIIILPSVKSVDQKGDLTNAEIEFVFADGDTGETHTAVMWGCGQDKGDKGIYKAYTGAVKYLLMKTFLVSTGDDPEDDSPKGKPTAKPQAPPIARPPVPAPTPTPQTPTATITEAQASRLYAAAAANGWTHEQVKATLAASSGKYTTALAIPATAYETIVTFFEMNKPPGAAAK
jgi:hypothetical protein